MTLDPRAVALGGRVLGPQSRGARPRQAEGCKRARVERERLYEQRRDEYHDYLLSEERHKKRALIFKRAVGLCQGCRQSSSPPKRVHDGDIS
jgi:hypothetical protein